MKISKRLNKIEIYWTESSKSPLRASQTDWLINRVKHLTMALENLYTQCMIADQAEDLSMHIDGSTLDMARKALEE